MKMLSRIIAMVLTIVLVIGFLPMTAYAGLSTKYPELAEVGQYFTIAVNYYNGYAIKEDGTLWAWGKNLFGDAFGNGWTEDYDNPTQIMSDVKSVRAKASEVYALKTDGSVWVWGAMYRAYWNTANKILDDVAVIAAEYEGHNGVYVIKTDGTLCHWTYENGEIALLTNVKSVFLSHQVMMYGDQLPESLSLNGYFAVKTDGTIWKEGSYQDEETWESFDIPLTQVTEQVDEIVAALKPQLPDDVAAETRDGYRNRLTLYKDGTLRGIWDFEDVEILSNVRMPDADTIDNSSQPTDSPSAWAVDQVSAAISVGLVPNALQTNYTQATTRAEFCALAVALFETIAGSEITQRESFVDTDDTNVEKMAALGVVNGVGNDRFNPNGALNREQAATMLSRLADAIGKPLESTGASLYGDENEISSWALDAVMQMQTADIMGGVGDSRFAPKSDYQRQQSIVTILRLFEIVK